MEVILEIFEVKDDILLHKLSLILGHDKGRGNVCMLCYESFKSDGSLRRHSKQHFVCHFCPVCPFDIRTKDNPVAWRQK